MKVLVAYGSKRGGTAGIAEMLGGDLVAEGMDVDVRSASDVKKVDGYDAVIVGGALYAMRWNKKSRRFVKHHKAALREKPVWFFSSGPLDESATDHEIPETHQVHKLMERVHARGHVTFGGALSPDAKGFPASAMAKKNAGDWRDPEQIRAFAHEVAEEMATTS
jgi:menaquinone-dependent protoporphyrinogen oxidase